MKDSRFKYIKNLKLRKDALTFLSVGMTVVGSLMFLNNNNIVGSSLVYGGLYTAGVAQEYFIQANTVIGGSKEKIKIKLTYKNY